MFRMDADDIDIMTREMRKAGARIPTRSDLNNYAYYLMRGLYVIGKTELADQLQELYDEMESVNTNEIYMNATFREETKW